MDIKKAIKEYIDAGTSTQYDFGDILHSITNKKIFKIPGDSEVKKQIISIAEECVKQYDEFKKGCPGVRINEIGNEFEKMFLKKLFDDLTGELIFSGGVGYPDGCIKINEDYWYIEVKTFNTKTMDSTLRSFYTQPSKKYKVKHDGYHLLVGFEKSEDNKTMTGVHTLDLIELNLKLKMEFNASNKDMYIKKEQE